MKSIWMITRSGVFVLIVAVFGLVQNKRCIQKGFIIEGKGSKEFRVCSKDTDGGLTLKTFLCAENSVFSAEKKRCVLGSPVLQEPNKRIHPPPNVHAFQSQATTTRRAPLTNRPRPDDQAVVLGMHPPPCFSPSKEWEYGVNPCTIPKRRPELKRCPIARGRFCNTCTTLVSCVNYREVAVDHCYSCSPYTNSCTDEFVPECMHGNNFLCTSFGLFPDPYFCSRYHFCQGPDTESHNFHCDPGMIYDAYLEECRDDISGRYHYDSPCPSFPKCQEDFQVGVMQGNNQFYYVCLEDKLGILRRDIYKCPKNNIFNGNECVLKELQEHKPSCGG